MPCLILAVLLLLICIVVLPVTGASKRHGIEREVRKKYYLVGGLTVQGVVILFRNHITFNHSFLSYARFQLQVVL